MRGRRTPEGDIDELYGRVVDLERSSTSGASGGIAVYFGAGTPEGAVTGSVGDVYVRSNGLTGTTIYEKTSDTGNTGWTAQAILGGGIVEGDLSLSDIATANSSAARHGFLRKLSGSINDVLIGDGTWASVNSFAGLGSPSFGDGSDGAVTFDGTTTYVAFATTTGAAPNLAYTLTRDVYVTSMTVSSGISVSVYGCRVFCTGTLTNAGTIRADGADASGATPGQKQALGSITGGTFGSFGIASGTTTQAGGAGANTSSSYITLGGRGGTGGNSNGGAAGTVGTNAKSPGWRDVQSLASLTWPTAANSAGTGIGSLLGVGGGTGGGAGGRTTGGTAATSGGGGEGGGIVFIVARTIVNTAGVIQANGGNGAAATGGTTATGGGGAGGGGVVFLIYGSLAAGTEQSLGGTKGAGINGAAAAADGSNGTVVKIVVG